MYCLCTLTNINIMINIIEVSLLILLSYLLWDYYYCYHYYHYNNYNYYCYYHYYYHYYYYYHHYDHHYVPVMFPPVHIPGCRLQRSPAWAASWVLGPTAPEACPQEAVLPESVQDPAIPHHTTIKYVYNFWGIHKIWYSVDEFQEATDDQFINIWHATPGMEDTVVLKGGC